MANQALIDAAKMAAHVTTSAYDERVEMLLDSAMLDLGVAGVEVPETLTPLVKQAAITYFLVNFSSRSDSDRLKRSYDEQKAQLATCTGYTDWGESNG